MKCPKCGKEISAYDKTCPACGTPIIKIRPKRVCMNCGSEVPDDASVCPGCGRPVKRRSTQQGEERDTFYETGTEHTDPKASRIEAIIQALKKDRYAWLQAVLPPILAFLYHAFFLQDNETFNLMNTALILEGLTFFFGYLDVKDISQRTEMYGGMAFSSRYVYLSYFLPVLSFWERRTLPGMKRNALYPVVYAGILLLFVVLMLMSSHAVALYGAGSGML